MADKKQRLIANFFKPANGKVEPLKETKPVKRTFLTTPEKIGMMRSNSVLSSSNDGFDDITSSDTSFGSPDFNNFRNPVYGMPHLQYEKNVKVEYRSAGSSLKRVHASLLDVMESMDTVSRKLPKLSRPKLASSQSQPQIASVTLSKEQEFVISQIVDQNKNIFYTGSAGTGKSVVLRELVNRLVRKYGGTFVGVTASTGLAACNIGGQTLHRFLGIGIGQASPEIMLKSIEKKPMLKRRWLTLRVLIIDEISMIDGVLFSKLDKLAKILRKNDKPFGGIQVVCTGDFFQLPPVGKGTEAQYCFESDSWKSVIEKTLLLTQVFRQKGDNQLINMLNCLRFGELDGNLIEQFYELQKPKQYSDGIEPTELFPTREEVKRANDRRLNVLDSKAHVFTAEDSTTNEFEVKLLENLMCEKVITLKPGAQVMYLKNRDDGIVNGSIGKVVFMCPQQLYPYLDESYDRSTFTDEATLQEINIILSRVGNKTPSGNDAAETALIDQMSDEHRGGFLKLLNVASRCSTSDIYPVVCFKDRLGNDLCLLVTPEDFTVESGAGAKKELRRTQLPLLLSWAMSIHKSQGQTIQRLRVDLRRIFEKGQVYVALSRAVDKENLEIRNFDPKRIIASDKVKQFYNGLQSVQ